MTRRLLLILILVSTLLQATPLSESSLAKLYIATFKRAPDSKGFEYWLKSGFSLEQIARSFFDQRETKQMYPDGYSDSDFIEAIYHNLFDRSADREGFEYWLDALQSGRVSRDLFILATINGALGDDATLLANRARVGVAFARADKDSISIARYVVREVDHTSKSVDDTICKYTLGSCKTEESKENLKPSSGGGGGYTPPVTATPPATQDGEDTLKDNGSVVISLYVGEEFEESVVDDGSSGEFRLESAPKGMAIIPSTGIITWTPTKRQVGEYNVIAQLYRDGQLLLSKDYNISVSDRDIIYGGYFVDPTLPSNSSATGSEDDPFTSFKDACRVAKGGDNLYLRGGIYYSSDYLNGDRDHSAFIRLTGCEGSVDDHIVIRPWGNELVKLLTDGYAAISVYNSRYLTIESLEVEGVTQKIDISEATKEWWESNKYYNGGGISIVKSSYGGTTHDIKVRDCIVHDLPAGGIKGYNATHVVIENNIVYNTNWWTTKGTTAVGIVLAPALDSDDESKQYNQIVGNLLFGTEQRLFSRDWPKSGTNFVIDEGEAILIQEGMRTASDTDGTERTGYSARYLVKDNLVVYNGKGIISNLADKVDIYNNTLYMNGTTSTSPYTNLSSAGFNISSSDDINLVKNIVKSKSDGITIWYSSSTTNLNRSANHFSGHFLDHTYMNYDGITKHDISEELLKNPTDDNFNPIDDLSGIGADIDKIVSKAKRYGIDITTTDYECNNTKTTQLILDTMPDYVDVLGYDDSSSEDMSYLYIRFPDDHPHTIDTGDNNYTIEIPKLYLDGVDTP